MRPIHTDLPAPTGGMLLAKRPTGVILGFVVMLIALVWQTIPAVAKEISDAVNAAMAGVPFNPAVDGVFDRDTGVLALFSFGLATLWIWFWIGVKERRRFSTLGFTQAKTGVRFAGRGLLIGIGMLAACVLVPVLTGQAQLAWASPDATSLSFILIMLIGFLVQGSTEEILTRGYLTQVVARRWGLVAAVVVQSLFFMAIHGMNPGMGILPIINLLLFALFASFLSLSEGGLWGICAMHGAWNWAQGNLFGVAVSGQPVSDSLLTYTANPGSIDLLTGGTFGIEGSIVTSVVYLVGIVITWRAWQKRRALESATAVQGAEASDQAAVAEGAISREP